MYSALHDYLVNYHLSPPGEVEALRILQHYAIGRFDISANQFTKEKNELLDSGQLCPTPWKIKTQFPTQILSKGKPDSKKLKTLTEILYERAELLRPQQVGAAGEIHCRALFVRLKYEGFPIHSVPQKRRVGYERIEGSHNRKDLQFHYTDRKGKEYQVLVENRNRNEHTYPTNGEYFSKLIDNAFQANLQPVLMASYLPERSITLCEAIGIAVHVYGRQFLDSKIRANVSQLFPKGLYKELFQFVHLPQPFANYPSIDDRSMRDLELIGNRSWIEDAHAQWLNMKPWIPKITEALARGDIRTVDGLLEDYA
jgi:hypothetical protein